MAKPNKLTNGLTEEQVAKLKGQGLPMELIETFETSDLLAMIETMPNQSFVLRTTKRQQNVSIELDGVIGSLIEEGEKELTLSREEVAEQIRLLNQESFFTVTDKEGQPFKIPNSKHVLGYFYNPSFTFACQVDNKKTEGVVSGKDKAKIAIGLWVKRGRAIVSEIGNPNHSKYYNNKANECAFVMSDVKRGTKEITFTRV